MKELATSPVVTERGCLARRVVLRAVMKDNRPVKFVVHYENVENADDYYSGAYFWPAPGETIMDSFQKAWQEFVKRSSALVNTSYDALFGPPYEQVA